MKIPTQLLVLATLGIACSTLPLHANETTSGYVRSNEGGNLLVCFNGSNVPSAGETLNVTRTAVVTAPKNETPIRRKIVGSVRIDAVDASHCAHAELIGGEAHARDWLQARPKS